MVIRASHSVDTVFMALLLTGTIKDEAVHITDGFTIGISVDAFLHRSWFLMVLFSILFNLKWSSSTGKVISGEIIYVFPGRRFRSWIPKEPARKRQKKRWILQEHTGSRRNMKAVFRPENFWILSCAFRQEPVGNHWKEFRNFPAGILLPCSGGFRCIPAGTVPYSLTWVIKYE